MEAAKAKLAGLKTAHDDMQFQLEVQAEEAQKQLQAMQSELALQLAEREEEIAEWKAKYQAAAAAAPTAGENAETHELQQQLNTLEQQRTDLAHQLFAIQDELRRQQEDFLLSKNGMEGKLLTATNQIDILEAEKSAWQSQAQSIPGGATGPLAPLSDLAGDSARHIAGHRQRLLHKARTLRAFRQQVGDYQRGLEKNREEIAQQREQLRAARRTSSKSNAFWKNRRWSWRGNSPTTTRSKPSRPSVSLSS